MPFFFFWLMKLRDRLWTAECRFSIQTNNGADSVSVNGDQACLDEGFGGRRRLWDSPSLSLSAIAFLNRVLTSCVRREGKMPPVHAVRTWSERPTPHFHIKDTCEGCCTVLTCKKKKGKKHSHSLCHFTVLPFFQYFLCFTIHRLSLVVSSHSRFFPHFWSLLICLPPSWTDALFLCHLNFLFLFLFFLLLSRSPSPLSSPPHILWSLFDEAPENRLLSHRGQAAQTAAVPSLLQRDPAVLTFEPSSMK